MPFVLDCSMTMAWLFPDEANDSTNDLRENLMTDSAVVPALWPMEVGNVLLVATRRGRVSSNDWPQIRNALAALPIGVDPMSCDTVLDAVLPVAEEHRLAVYDAMYLELALRREMPIATLDRKLISAANAAGVEVKR